MKSLLIDLRSSALMSALLVLPFIILEVVNRRHLNEDFPTALFFVIWLNFFAVSLILLPIVWGRRVGNADPAKPVPAQRESLLTNPWSAAILSIVLAVSPGIFPLLDSLGWISMETLFNGPDPAQLYVPGQIMALVLILFPVAAGVIAGRPIARTLQAGGSFFAHQVNLIIVGARLFLFSGGLGGLLVDQWPCFMGVPNCD